MRRTTLGLAISAILAPTLSYALGLGEISTNSALNQPLDAEIELVSTSPAEVDNVSVNLAPNAVFDQVGIERTPVLDNLTFTPTVINGVPVIKVTSGAGIQEPFINFVIEVAWPKGKLLREYTVLLDPPVLSEQAGPPPVAAAPVTEGQAPFMTPAPAPVPTPAPVEQVAQAETYPVAEAVPVPQPVAPEVSTPETYPVDTVPVSETFSVAEAVGEAPFVSTPAAPETYPVDEGLPPFVSESTQVAQADVQPIAEADVQPLEESVAELQPAFEEPLPLEEGVDPFASAASSVSFDEAPGTSEIFVSGAGTVAAPAEPQFAEQFAEEELLSLSDEPIFVDAQPLSEDIATGYAGGDSYAVKRGDTLSSIARQLRPGDVNMNRMMAAFAQANPGAFVDNSIHKLKAGYVLRIPDAETLAAIDDAEAKSIIANKGGAWQQYKTAMADKAAPQAAADAAKDAAKPEPAEGSTAAGLDNLAAAEPREEEEAKKPGLEIVSPDGEGAEAQGSADAEAAAAETTMLKEQLASRDKEAEELRSRVAELEALLAAKDRLIDLKDQQLAELQTSLDDTQAQVSQIEAEKEKLEAEAEAAPEAEAASTPAASGLLPTAEQEQPAAEPAELPKPVREEAPVEKQPAPEPEPVMAEEKPVQAEAAPAEEAAEPESSGQNPRNLLLGGGAGLLLLALLAWWSSRRKSNEEELYDTDSSEQVQTTVTEVAGATAAEVTDEVEEEVATEFDNELATGQFDSIDAEATADIEETSHSIQIDASELNIEPEEIGEDLTSVDIDLNEDEVLSEANVYLAYGLHDQAIDLLKPVVEANPERLDYQAKLAEAYHATGDKNNFVSLAENMHSNLTANDESLWQRTAVMGKDLLPEHDLFKSVDTGDLTLSNIRKDRPDLADLDLDDMPDLEDAEATLSMEKAELSQELSGDLSEEFQLPELEDLEQSLQIDDAEASLAEADKSQQIELNALGDLDESLPGDSQLMDENLTLAEMENELIEVTTGADHMGTKLDLAKAYIDMGDEEGAREALSEVISQGSDEQQGEAKKLLDQLG